MKKLTLIITVLILVYGNLFAQVNLDFNDSTNYNLNSKLDNLHNKSKNSTKVTNPTTPFTDIEAGLIGVYTGCSGSWEDYDNDGDLDIFLTGYSGSGWISKIYKNEGYGYSIHGRHRIRSYINRLLK